MPFSFYCTHCGRPLQQSDVLFDMQYVLTGDSNKTLNTIKFRMTLAELQALLEKGTADANGFVSCKFTFQQVMDIVAENYERDDPAYIGDPQRLAKSVDALRRLSMRDIDAYIAEQAVLGSGTVGERPQEELSFDLEDLAGLGDDGPEPPIVAHTMRDEVTPIDVLEEMDTSNKDRGISQVDLVTELKLFRAQFNEAGELRFALRAVEETDNDGGSVLTGYDLMTQTGAVIPARNARVCPACGEPVFEHAGTAKHQAVAFIGYQSSGKTSTILALSSYLRNCAAGDLGNEIWKGSKSLEDVVDTIEGPLSPTRQQSKDLMDFEEGFEPEKTDPCPWWENAYRATFRIRPRDGGEYHLLTLFELDHWLCLLDGRLDLDKIRYCFPLLLNCEAVIACVDTRSFQRDKANSDAASTGRGNSIQTPKEVNCLCSWTNSLQRARAEQNGASGYVPTLLLFTKCPELEDGIEIEEEERPLNPLERLHLLAKERQKILADPIYRYVKGQFEQYGGLNKAYHAMLRCSAFGPRRAQRPSPRQIDLLAAWILAVTGCIPAARTAALFKSGDREELGPVDDYRIERPQIRSQAPLRSARAQEALARCVLFEDPGELDRVVVCARYDNWVQKLIAELRCRTAPNGNIPKCR